MRAFGQLLSVLAAVMFIVGNTAAGPDPTRPPTPDEIRAWRGQAGDQPATWRLESILISEQRRVAVINGQTVSTGDQVDGAVVTAIAAGSVRLAARGEIVELTMDRQASSKIYRQDG